MEGEGRGILLSLLILLLLLVTNNRREQSRWGWTVAGAGELLPFQRPYFIRRLSENVNNFVRMRE